MKERKHLPINAGLSCEEMLTNLDTAKSKQILRQSFIYVSLQFVASFLEDKDEQNRVNNTDSSGLRSGIDLFV